MVTLQNIHIKFWSCLHPGKPEEMLIVYHAIKRGYVVVVIGPLLSGTDNLCFTRTWPPEQSWETAEVSLLPA